MKFLLFSLALTIATELHAQQKFIEVTVSDTVLAQAQTFVYKLTAIDDFMPYDTSVSADQAIEQRKSNSKRTLDSLIFILQQKGFNIQPLSTQDTFMLVSSAGITFSRRILIHSVDSLSQLYQLIKNNTRLMASVEVAVARDESVYQKALWKKLLAVAAEKAKTLAVSTNHRITGVISITDKPEYMTVGGWTSYPPLSRDFVIPGWHTTIGASELEVLNSTFPINTLYPIRGTCVVRFAME